MNKEISQIKKELAEGRSVLVATSGVSMEPLLHDKRKKNATHVLIVPPSKSFAVGDMPLVLMEDGRYILHRIVKIVQEQGKTYYITRGDNCITTEKVAEEQILGVVTEIYYKKGTLRISDTRYRFYVKIWTYVYPIRRLHKKTRNFCGKCKRFLLAKRR